MPVTVQAMAGQEPNQPGVQPVTQAHSAPHRHCGPHWHCGPQAQVFCWAGCWQPQVQPAPGQAVHGHSVGVVAFMVILLSVEMRCQCRRAGGLRIE